MATTISAPSEHSLATKVEALTVTETEIISPPATTEFETKLDKGLKPLLSHGAKVALRGNTEYQEITARWSDHNAPNPTAVVSVACEEDVCAIIKYARSSNPPIAIFAQTGGHAFSSSLLGIPSDTSIVINMRALNSASIDLEAGRATLGGGILTGEAILAAEKAKAHLMTGICNTVGLVAALMGGGMGNLMSMYGMGVDNMISARLVTATGEAVEVSGEEGVSEEVKELWWGMRGAGTNFGIVTSLTVKAYPQLNGGMHWTGTLGWPGSKEACATLMETIKDMGMSKGTGINVIFARIPGMGASVIANLWSPTSEAEARIKYAPLFALNPAFNMCAEVPYTLINAPNDIPCIKGGRKPIYASGLQLSQLQRLADGYVEWETFSSTADTEKSVVIVEIYDYGKARTVDAESTAFPWRDVDVHAFTAPNTSLLSLDAEVTAHGARFRSILYPDKKEEERKVYMNFGNGNEKLGNIFGDEDRLERLRRIKRRWDPEGLFSFYCPIH